MQMSIEETLTEDIKAYAAILSDAINPSHYKQGGIECIDAIKASMKYEEFAGYLKGNIIKYLWRYKDKNGVEDLRKAAWYLEKLIAVES